MSLSQHICKGVLIRRNIASGLCTAVGCQQFRKESRKCQRRIMFERNYQRWSPRGQILKSLALASKPEVLENCPVLGSRTALFFGPLKFC